MSQKVDILIEEWWLHFDTLYVIVIIAITTVMSRDQWLTGLYQCHLMPKGSMQLNYNVLITTRQRSCRKVMFPFVSVCQSFCPMWPLPMMHWTPLYSPHLCHQTWTSRTSDLGHYWKSVQTCSFKNPTPWERPLVVAMVGGNHLNTNIWVSVLH